jgi:putative transposase
MNIDISVPEVIELFKEIQVAPEKLFEIMRLDIRKIAGDYLSSLMESELASLDFNGSKD